MTIVLLGPQRRPALRSVLRDLEPVVGSETPVAVVNAGWRDREDDDGELLELLDRRGVNLALYRRWLDATQHDPALVDWDAARQHALDELAQVADIRVQHAMAAVQALHRRRGEGGESGVGIADLAWRSAVEDVCRLDAQHLRQVTATRRRFDEQLAALDHPRLDEHRHRVAELLAPTRLLVLTGGHVGVLLDLLRRFDVTPGDRSVIAWSAGAMALAERVLLFHDYAPHGPAHPRMHDHGLGLVRGVVPLPHARRRLRLDDATRTVVLVERARPATCLVLDDGARVALTPAGTLPPEAKVLDDSGRITPYAQVAA